MDRPNNFILQRDSTMAYYNFRVNQYLFNLHNHLMHVYRSFLEHHQYFHLSFVLVISTSNNCKVQETLGRFKLDCNWNLTATLVEKDILKRTYCEKSFSFANSIFPAVIRINLWSHFSYNFTVSSCNLKMEDRFHCYYSVIKFHYFVFIDWY